MRPFLLFIDTETSGLPKKWDLPYSVEGNWPHAVQFSWTVYTVEGRLIKQENHYIGDPDFTVTPESIQVHGITRAFLDRNGEPRRKIMELLTADLIAFDPVVIGHFIELDLHLAGAEYYRSGMENIILQYPSYCTMQATRHLVRHPQKKFFRLGDLYERLFQRELGNQHNAYTDVNATAQCFFELLRRKEISIHTIGQQKEEILQAKKISRKAGWGIFALMITLLSALIAFCL